MDDVMVTRSIDNDGVLSVGDIIRCDHDYIQAFSIIPDVSNCTIYQRDSVFTIIRIGSMDRSDDYDDIKNRQWLVVCASNHACFEVFVYDVTVIS